MQIGLGPITTQFDPQRQPQGSATLWSDALAQTELAEKLGFDSVWVSEHHFTGDGYLAAVMPLLAAMAARTQRVLIGTKVMLAPLHDPVRVAEDAAAVNGISNGRLLLGLGIGYREEEFAGLGVSTKDRAKRMSALVQTCRQAWAGQTFTPPNRDVAISLGPEVTPVPLYLGGAAPAALERAGRIGDGYVAPISTPEAAASRWAEVRKAAEEANRPVPALITGSHVVLRDRKIDAQEQDLGLASLLASYDGYTKPDQTKRTPATVVEGDAATVARQLNAFAGLVPEGVIHHHVVRLEYPGMPWRDVEATLRIFARDVMPLLKEYAS